MNNPEGHVALHMIKSYYTPEQIKLFIDELFSGGYPFLADKPKPVNEAEIGNLILNKYSCIIPILMKKDAFYEHYITYNRTILSGVGSTSVIFSGNGSPVLPDTPYGTLQSSSIDDRETIQMRSKIIENLRDVYNNPLIIMPEIPDLLKNPGESERTYIDRMKRHLDRSDKSDIKHYHDTLDKFDLLKK